MTTQSSLKYWRKRWRFGVIGVEVLWITPLKSCCICYFVKLKNLLKQRFEKADYQSFLGRTLGTPYMSQTRPSPLPLQSYILCVPLITNNGRYQYPNRNPTQTCRHVTRLTTLSSWAIFNYWRSHLIWQGGGGGLTNFWTSVYWSYWTVQVETLIL